MLPKGYDPTAKRKGGGQHIPRTPKVFRMLDLFSGTGSVGAYFRGIGYEVVSVDVERRYEPDIIADIGTWPVWKFFPKGWFDVVGCCPPCTEYSRAMTSRPRDFEKADRLVKAALEVVDYLQPTLWFLENPRLGELRKRDFMTSIPFIDVDYCMFSDWGYQKPTRIWGSPNLNNVGNCLCEGWCQNMEYNQGTGWSHRLKLGCTAPPGKTKPTQEEQYRLPHELLRSLLWAEPSLHPESASNPPGGEEP